MTTDVPVVLGTKGRLNTMVAVLHAGNSCTTLTNEVHLQHPSLHGGLTGQWSVTLSKAVVPLLACLLLQFCPRLFEGERPAVVSV